MVLKSIFPGGMLTHGTLVRPSTSNAKRVATSGVFVEDQALEQPAQRVVGIKETKREEQPIGSVKRTIDNSSSRVELERKLVVSRQWIQTWSVEYEKTK